MKRALLMILIGLMIITLAACGGEAEPAADNANSPRESSTALSAGEDFRLGDETYALEKWVRLPKYDSGSQRGLGLCFVQKEGVAPIVISGSSYSSLIDMTLDMDGTKLGTSNISFIAVDDAPGYAGRVTFEFTLSKDVVLPEYATIYHTGIDAELSVYLGELEAPDIAEATAEAKAEPDVAAAPNDFGKEAFYGEWLLNAITFRTPDGDNGIYAIDATMGISVGFEFGRELILKEDMGMTSNINLRALLEAVDELPFTIEELNLLAYSGWEYANGTLTLTPVGPAFTAVYDEAAGEVRLIRSGEVAILSTTTDGMTTQSGSVLLDITMAFISK